MTAGNDSHPLSHTEIVEGVGIPDEIGEPLPPSLEHAEAATVDAVDQHHRPAESDE